MWVGISRAENGPLFQRFGLLAAMSAEFCGHFNGLANIFFLTATTLIFHGKIPMASCRFPSNQSNEHWYTWMEFLSLAQCSLGPPHVSMTQRLGRKRGGRCVVQLQATASWACPEKFYPGDDNGRWMSMMFFTWFTYSSATKLEWKLISWGGKRHTVTTCDNHWHHLTITFGRSDSWFQCSQHAPVGSLPQSFPASFCPWPLARQAVSRMTCRLCSQAIERQQSTEEVNNRFGQVYRLRNARNKGNSFFADREFGIDSHFRHQARKVSSDSHRRLQIFSEGKDYPCISWVAALKPVGYFRSLKVVDSKGFSWKLGHRMPQACLPLSTVSSC